MKTLYLIRHAKSSWDYPLLTDVERPLNGRGKRDAPRMGKRLKEKHVIPDLMITSHAKRTRDTSMLIAETIGYPTDRIKTEPNLYHASEEEILGIIKSQKDNCHIVMLFGHNPGLTDLVNQLPGRYIENVPTCGIVAIQFDVDTWQEVDLKKGSLLFFDYPKSKED